METKQSIGYYIGRETNRYFKIPAYQRGYKWGELKSDDSCDASILVKDILQAMHNNKAEYFIQGVTVFENNSDVVLIDGQQRTTTVFLLLSLLLTSEEIKQYLFFKDQFKLKYDIRKKTQDFLKNHCLQIENEIVSQDEFFLAQASQKMQEVLPVEKEERDLFKIYLLERVKLFYVRIPEKHATRVFSILNGSKAFMTTDELIKSAFLSEATKSSHKKFESKNLSETLDNLTTQIGEEWQTTTSRSRYARQWDKWMYWWNREEVKAFYYCENNPMGRLLEYFYEYHKPKDVKGSYSNKPEKVATMFKNFQNLFIQDTKAAKENFDRLRKLQKTFEDLYNNVTTHNYFGLVLTLQDRKDSLRVIHYFISNFKDEERVKKFSLYTIMGVSEEAIKSNNKIVIDEKLKTAFARLSLQDVYNSDAKEVTFKMLFLLNVMASNARSVKFEFFYNDDNKLTPFYKYRSLEHIWPKSKVVFYKNEQDAPFKIDEKGNELRLNSNHNESLIYKNDFNNEDSEHCIGNLLLLHKNDNSKFNAKLPEQKKLVYFNLDEPIYSRNLLHTMSAFAIENWSQENTINNISVLKQRTILKIKEIYSDVG